MFGEFRGIAEKGFRDERWGDGTFAKAAWPRASPLLSPGLSPQKLCPQGSSNCRKQCEQDYYVNSDGRCTACVSCRGKSLVL